MMIPSLVDGAVTVNPVVLTSVSTHAPEIVSIVVAVGKSGTGTVAVGATVETSGGAATRGGSSPNIILQVLYITNHKLIACLYTYKYAMRTMWDSMK